MCEDSLLRKNVKKIYKNLHNRKNVCNFAQNFVRTYKFSHLIGIKLNGSNKKIRVIFY